MDRIILFEKAGRTRRPKAEARRGSGSNYDRTPGFPFIILLNENARQSDASSLGDHPPAGRRFRKSSIS
jgi:hypothetical protein